MKARVERITRETQVEVNLEFTPGPVEINTGNNLLNHHITALATHGSFSLSIKAKDDGTEDAHHLFEDVAITLGTAIDQALGQRKIARFGWCLLPMDEVLVRCALDMVKRPFFSSNMRKDMFRHFLRSLAFSGGFNLHMDVLKEGYTHHETEACFKALGVALKQALSPTKKEFPSTK